MSIVLESQSRIPLQWNNNSCESINHILKLNRDWKPEKLPELINGKWCIVWSW